MTERYDDSDSSWEFVGKDSSDSEDEEVKPRRVQHDTGLPEELAETIELQSMGKVDTDSDIEVCTQTDETNDEDTSDVLDDQVAAVPDGNENIHTIAAPETVVVTTDESDVERIEEDLPSEESSVDLQAENHDETLTPDESAIVQPPQEPALSSSEHSTDSTISVKYMGFDIVGAEDRPHVEEVLVDDETSAVAQQQSEEDALLSLEDKSSQTTVCSTSSISIGTVAMETSSVATGSDGNHVHDNNSWLIAAVFLTALGMGFSLGAMYNTTLLADVRPVVPAPYNPQEPSCNKQNKPVPSLSVDVLKEKITNLRMENDRLKHRTKMVVGKNHRNVQLKKRYKTAFVQQQMAKDEVHRKLKHVRRRNKRKIKQHKLMIAEAMKAALHYRHLYDLNKQRRSTPLQDLAIEILYSEIQNKSIKIIQLQYELNRNENEHAQNTQEFIAEQAQLKASLAEQKARTSKLRRILVQTIAKLQQPSSSHAANEVLTGKNQEQNVSNAEEEFVSETPLRQCVIESHRNTQNIDETTTENVPVHDLFLNLSMPVFNDYAEIVSSSKSKPDYPTLHRLFLSIIRNENDEADNRSISYVPAVYFDHSSHLQGMCRISLNRIRRNAYILFLKNKYATDQMQRQSQEIFNIKSQLNFAKSTIFEFQQNQTKTNESDVCKREPTMNECVASVINATALQPYMNFTNIKDTVNIFAHEMNQSAHNAWEKIVKTIKKQKNKFEKVKKEQESKPREKKQKKWKNKNEEESAKSSTHRRKDDKQKKKGDWWQKKREKSKQMFGKIHQNVKKAVKNSGRKIQQAFKSAKTKSHKIKDKVQKFYQQHKQKPQKIAQEAQYIGKKVLENLMNVTQAIIAPTKHAIYCYGTTSANTGCSEDINNMEDEEDVAATNVNEPEDENEIKDLWYIKRSQEREKARSTKEECEDDDWYFKRQEIRAVLRMQEEEKRQYESMIRKHIDAAARKDSVEDEEDDDFVDDYTGMDKKTKDAVDNLIYFNFDHQKDDRVLFPNL